MAASEPCARPKPAFVYMVRCTGGTLYTGWTTDLPPACAHTRADAAQNTPVPEGPGILPIWNCARISAPPCGGSMPSSSCPRPRRNCCAAHGARRAGHFPAHKAKTKPGTLSGQTAHKRVPGFLFLRCEFFPCAVVRTCPGRDACAPNIYCANA